MYFVALRDLASLNNPQLITIFTEELINLHRGQGMDLHYRDSLTCPTEDDYLEMVSNKTGGLFRLAVKLMEAESSVLRELGTTSGSAKTNGVGGAAGPGAGDHQHQHHPLSCIPLINTIGLMFQILDDLLNLQSAHYASRKGAAEDLTEGKFSFPVIHAIRSDPGNRVLPNILQRRTTDDEVKRFAVQYMERRGSFDYSRRVIEELERKAVKEVARLEEGGLGREGGERVRGMLGRLRAL